MDEERLEELLEEATVDCYDEEEEFMGVMYTLEEHLTFPLEATIAGVPVRVHGFDDTRSGLRRGIVARVERAGEFYSVGLSELMFVGLDAESSEWLEMYLYWLQ